ncbi:RHS repeat-associated core domain-containing protein [Streptomyces sp. NPDC094032]|uniref:RHS repeat domain-containing protein n=1 Tax=Streptomyces sp. NPDC094032 TaxID=3155308 RepID=UPI00332F5ADB
MSVSDAARRAGTLPIALARPTPKTRASAAAASEQDQAQDQAHQVEVEILPRAKVERAGFRGVLFALREAEAVAGSGTGTGSGGRGGDKAGSAAAARAAGQVAVTVDYNGFRHAYGGSFASRLGLVRYPACIVDHPETPACAAGTSVASRNDLEAGHVSAPAVEVAAAGTSDRERGAFVYALEASASGSSGSYKATDLLNSADWSVSGNSGAFSYAYPLSAPPAPGGDPLKLALSYSSQSVDGRTSAQNAQPSWVGQGWDITPGFIERRYHSCANDGQSAADLCWKDYDQVAISLGGRSTQLIPLDAGRTIWRLRDDPGWSVTRETGTTNGDNDGEFWWVRSPDGTKYRFGGETDFGGGDLDSTWTVPVYGDDTGEPCKAATFAASWCHQGWRWNLDMVVDRNNNMTVLHWGEAVEGYGRNGSTTRTDYVRGGWLNAVEYGRKWGESPTATPATGRLAFTTDFRCTESTTCPSIENNPTSYPDVPADLICWREPCKEKAPTFFSTIRLKQVTLTVGGRAIAKWELGKQFPAPGDGSDASLWLSRIQRYGSSDGGTTWQALPAVQTYGTALDNRVDHNVSAGVLPMKMYRVTKLQTELGGLVEVAYTRPHPCTAVPANAAANTDDCFPQFHVPEAGPAGWGWFHKYLVDKVTVRDPHTGSPDQVTDYFYYGTPAWHHDEFSLAPASAQSWSQWRGYPQVTVVKGSGADRTTTSSLYFRGMHGDSDGSGGTRTVKVTDSEGNALLDHVYLAGRLRETTAWGLDAGNAPSVPLTKDLSTYTGPRTIDHADGDTRDAIMLAETTHDTWAKTATGGRWTRTVRAFDDTYNQVTSEYEHGDTTIGGDERCTTTGYVHGGTAYMYYPYQTETHAGDCAATVVSRTQTWYDGHTSLTTDPVAYGNPTQVRSFTSGTGYVETRATYDGYGRVLTSTDGRGLTTATAYAPAKGNLSTVTVTDPKGHTVTTTMDPAFATPVSTADANGRTTTSTYDAFGRITAVRLPGTAASDAADYLFTYQVNQSAPSRTSTIRITDRAGGTYLSEFTFLDALGRTAETQTPSPSGTGRIVTQTRYDNQGRTAAATAPMYMAGTSGTALAVPSVADIPSETRTAYDTLGRASEAALWSKGAKRHATTTTWHADQATVSPPAGQPTTHHLDALGRTTRVVETLDSGSATTTYGYDSQDRLTRITDAKGNITDYTYDWLGRRLTGDDPDTGLTTTAYDADGNPTTSTDARGRTVVSTYDELNRRTHLRKDSATGALLASWRYDPPGNKGALESTTRHTDGEEYAVAHAYDSARGRLTATTWTLPAGEGALAGPYTQTFAYDDADRPRATTYPAAGGLPAETVTQTYTDLGLPARLTSPLGTYIDATGYAADGKLTSRALGTSSTPHRVDRSYGYDPATLEVTSTKATLGADATVIQDDTYRHDAAGNVLQVTDNSPSGAGQSQCYDYDGRNRLLTAWTTPISTCSAATRVGWNTPPGPDRYRQDLTYDTLGNITSRADNGGIATVYGYPASGPASVRPHAVTSVGDDTYGYDESGNMSSRTVTGVSSTYTWNETRQLITATVGGKSTDFVYDADGSRLVRRTPDGARTASLAGTEITADAAGTVTARRYYTSGGATVAVRTPGGADGTVHWLLGDTQGSAHLAVDTTTGTVSRQRYLPFGAHRGTSDALRPTTDRGFLGKPEDDTTGLVHLSARSYDPTIGRFLSADPLVDMRTPQLMNAYTYGGNNPATFSDPMGLCIAYDGGCMPAPPRGPSPGAVDRVDKQLAEQNRRHRTTRATHAKPARHLTRRDAVRPERNGHAPLRCRSTSCDPKVTDDPEKRNYDYAYSYLLGPTELLGNAEDAMTLLKDNPQRVFPFDVTECSRLTEGVQCLLEPNPGGFKSRGSGYVQVSTEKTSFTFTVVSDEYFDKPGSTITFAIHQRDNTLYLTQTAHGIDAAPHVLFGVDSGLSKWTWMRQAWNLSSLLYEAKRAEP